TLTQLAGRGAHAPLLPWRTARPPGGEDAQRMARERTPMWSGARARQTAPEAGAIPIQTEPHSSRNSLLPLDSPRRFGGDVEHAAVDAFHFVDDPVGDFFEQFVRQLHPVGGHAVLRFHYAQRNGVILGPFVAHH